MLSEIYANRESAKLTGILDAFSLLCWISSAAERVPCKHYVRVSESLSSSNYIQNELRRSEAYLLSSAYRKVSDSISAFCANTARMAMVASLASLLF